MTQLNKWFSRKEFKCKCNNCDQDTVDAELLAVLTDVREHFDAPVIINSANRCLEYNRSPAIGSKDTSQHVKSKASDIVVKGHSPDDVHRYLTVKYPDTYGIGSYDTFTHIDVRENKARW